MKLCGRDRMTQRSSSILLALAVLTIVYVERTEGFFLDTLISETTTDEPPITTITTTKDTADDHVEENQKKDNNETQQYHLDIQMNFIDSDPKNLANEEDNFVQEIRPEEPPLVLDLANEFQNITSSTDIDNATSFEESIGRTTPDEVPLSEIANVGQQSSNESNTSSEEGNNVPLEVSTEPNTDQTMSTAAPTKEETTRIDIVMETTSHVEETTPSVEIHQKNPTIKTHRIEKIQDLSIFFEDEPTRARQLRGFNMETDNEIITQNDDGSGSESGSNNSQSSESESNLSFSPQVSSSQDENHAAEDLSENVSTEKTFESKSPQEQTTLTTQTHLNIFDNVGLNNGLLKEEEPTKSVSSESIDNIEAVTESIGEITKNVTEVLTESSQTVIKNLGIDNELPSAIHVTEESIQEPKNEIQATTELDPVVNFVLNRTVEDVEEPSSTPKVLETSPLNTKTDISDSHSLDLIPEKINQLEEVLASSEITAKSLSETTKAPKLEDINSEPKSISEPEALDKDKEIEENIKSNQNNALDSNEQTSLPEQQRSIKPHPENDSNGRKDESTSGLNVIPDVSNMQDENILMENIETSTETPTVRSNEASLLEDVQLDQTSKTENGIFKEEEETPLNHPADESLPDLKLMEEAVETSTENPVNEKTENPTSDLLGNNQFGTTRDYVRHVGSLQTMRDESSSAISDKVIAPAAVGLSLDGIMAEGLGKPLPTRSVGDEPSTSSYSSEDKTTTVLVLCAAAGGIFIAFSVAIYLITFQRQHGTLDIEMQEQQCGKDDLDDDDDSQTRVSLLNQQTMVDSDEHSSD